jgi:hypothetical protein
MSRLVNAFVLLHLATLTTGVIRSSHTALTVYCVHAFGREFLRLRLNPTSGERPKLDDSDHQKCRPAKSICAAIFSAS